jgi:hypothetical protein
MEYMLDKLRSRQKIEILTDEYDAWFLHVNWVEKKTEKVTHSCCIIRKDLPGWLTYLQGRTGGNWIIKVTNQIVD